MLPRPRVTLAVVVALSFLALATFGGPAGAAATAYATWGPFEGTANAYRTTVQMSGVGFPAAAMTSDSRAGTVGVASSAFFNAATPLGQQYGSSQGSSYVVLRPRADNATAPSVTTYAFESPTPAQQWGFALSDIDADAVTVGAVVQTATGVREATGAELGFQGAFNLCSFGTPRPSGCTASIADVPTWDPATRTLTGNLQALDTVGASGWFQPTVRIRALTLTFTQRAGLPAYQTWFVNRTHALAGSVTDVSTGGGACPVGGAVVRLVDQNGRAVATTSAAADGTYAFGEVASQVGYRVIVEPPGGCAVVGPVEQVADASQDVVVPAFGVREIIPFPVSGRVTDDDGRPLAGVTVTLDGPDGATATTTDGDGRYLFDDNPIGDGYVVSVQPPPGYTGTTERPSFAVDDAPVTGQDFVLQAPSSVGGTVTGGGQGLPGVVVTLDLGDGSAPRTTVSGADGSYTFEGVPAGDGYAISVQPPEGYDAESPITGVAVGGADVTGHDFALTRPGALGGQVTGGDGPQPGVTVVVDGPGQPVSLLTDEDGGYYLGDLSPGTYTIEVTPPGGYEVVGEATRTVTTTDAGEVVGGQDFAVRVLATPPTSPPTSEPTTGLTTAPTVAAGGGSADDDADDDAAAGDGPGGLPDTGGSALLSLVVGALLAATGGTVLWVGRGRRGGPA
ncbi:MSCRAMM family protein [Mumia sp. DW29H23]|uniref:MSCRAMM family protein n=1 Tax=Mumia sp. DW29H23 TaxID=3421241 RepID=UPI003D680F78